MSKIKNCICISCDRCYKSETYESELQIENAGWGVDIKLDTEAPVDLCPACYNELGEWIRRYLYHYIHEKEV